MEEKTKTGGKENRKSKREKQSRLSEEEEKRRENQKSEEHSSLRISRLNASFGSSCGVGCVIE
jgi:hypothetical protein